VTKGKRIYVLDTNVLMHDPTALFKFEEHDVFLPMMVIEELDAAKKGNSEVSRNARQVSRFINELIENSGGQGLEAGLPLSHPKALQLKISNDVGRLYFQVNGDQNGANVDTVVVSPYVKSVFVTFMSDTNVASFRYAADGGKNTIIGTADFYEGPFGKVMVKPNRVMANSAAVARRAFLLDSDYVAMASLRPIQEDPDLAKTGDNKKGVIIGEQTLKIKNEAALGVVADIFGLTAST